MESLVNNNDFLDGNKRTGIATVALFLQRNGMSVTASNPQIVEFYLHVAQSQIDATKIADWLRTNSQPKST